MDNKTAEQALSEVQNRLREIRHHVWGGGIQPYKDVSAIENLIELHVVPALSAPRVPAGWVPEIHCGPTTHICWTPDYVEKDQRVEMVLISHSDYQKTCSLLAASPEPAHPEVVGITVASADSEPQDPLVKRAMLMVDAIDRDATIADLRAEVEALREDAERLDWLDKNATRVSDSERYLSRSVYWGGGTNKDVREAIDAARLREGG